MSTAVINMIYSNMKKFAKKTQPKFISSKDGLGNIKYSVKVGFEILTFEKYVIAESLYKELEMIYKK